ncbi:MAG: phosphohydrolase [Herpetosiphonaceae bacterium]|nr:MAG: phosphohydrolase [Herpetosiphonaceae bacterium]
MHEFISDLIEHPKVRETLLHMHHSIPKHDHIMRVTRYSYRLARLVQADPRICTRAAVIHDIDSRYGTLWNHGEVAARFAAEIGEDEAVCAAIRSHMYPLGPAPTSREGWVVTVADKAASLADFADFLRGLLTGKSIQRRRVLKQTDPFYRPRRRRGALRRAFSIDT